MDICIIIPAYNVEDYIEATLISVSRVDGNPQVVVVDDGSTDGTRDRVREILGSGVLANATLVEQSNAGVSAARNAGLQIARGEYVIFLDGDDRVEPALFRAIEGVAELDPPDIVCWAWDRVGIDGAILSRYASTYPIDSRMMSGSQALTSILIRREMLIWTGAIAYRRRLLLANSLRFTDGCSSGEDQEFQYRALGVASQVAFIGAVLSLYVSRPGSITKSFDIRRFDAVEALERASGFLAAVDDPRTRSVSTRLASTSVLDAFFYNLDSLIRIDSAAGIHRLLAETELQYPGMVDRIAELISAEGANGGDVPWQYKLFRISPAMFRYSVLLRKTLSPIKQKLIAVTVIVRRGPRDSC